MSLRPATHRLWGFGDDVAGDSLAQIFPSGQFFSYQLETGAVVQLPVEWDQRGDDSKLSWIAQSNLSAADAVQLEEEAGISDEGAAANYDTVLQTNSARPPKQQPASSSNWLIGLVAILGVVLVVAGGKK